MIPIMIIARSGEANDLVIAMLYDQHTPQDEPGPIAGQAWIERRGRQVVQPDRRE